MNLSIIKTKLIRNENKKKKRKSNIEKRIKKQ